MEEIKKKKPLLSVFCIILGLCLLALGTVLPNFIFKHPNNLFSIEFDEDNAIFEYEIEIETYEEIDVNNLAAIKFADENEEFWVSVFFVGFEDGANVYKMYSSGDYADSIYDFLEIKVQTEDGEELIFENEANYYKSGANATRIIFAMIPFVFGVGLLFAGFAMIVKKHFKKINESIAAVIFDEGEKQKEVERVEHNSITCRYCGIENEVTSAKCEYCGAPLIRKKNK